MHEKQLSERSAFISLTFADEHLPDDYGVHVRDLQLFNKRLRKARGPFRFFACGEYGDENLRPHYHSIIFGHDWAEDRYLWRVSERGHPLYRSPSLEKLWPFGHVEIGDVTYESAAYVARYVLKKITGKMAADHYSRVHPITGEVHQVNPEFVTMSTGGRGGQGGIGSAWFDRYSMDAIPSDFLMVNGKRVPVPRYYLKKQKATEDGLNVPSLHMETHRKQRARQHADNNTPERLQTREEVLAHKLAQKKREL